VRPGLSHDKHHGNTNGAYLIGLDGNGKSYPARQGIRGGPPEGGRIGVLLDLDAGWMRFCRKGKLAGAYRQGDRLAVLPGAVAPEGAGEERIVLDCGTCSSARLQGACRAKGLPVGGTKAALRARLEATAPHRSSKEQGRAPAPCAPAPHLVKHSAALSRLAVAH
jgi:hypothetical protein